MSEVYRTEWKPDQDDCYSCSSNFTLFNRRHHCRRCGNCVCGDCSPLSEELPFHGFVNERVRCCKSCSPFAKKEQNFYSTHLPVLIEGGTFVKHGLIYERDVLVMLSADGSCLHYKYFERKPTLNDIFSNVINPNNTEGEHKFVKTKSIMSIDSLDRTSIKIVTDDKNLVLQAKTTAVKNKFLQALRELVLLKRSIFSYRGTFKLVALPISAKRLEDQMSYNKENQAANEARQMKNERKEKSRKRREELRSKYSIA